MIAVHSSHQNCQGRETARSTSEQYESQTGHHPKTVSPPEISKLCSLLLVIRQELRGIQ